MSAAHPSSSAPAPTSPGGPEEDALPQEKLGAALGVFTPSILTILGVILFLRLGWVVGNVGLVGALLIIFLAHCITSSTALSVSAVTTNMNVGAGGAYYIISRSLGLEIGGAIGIPLFLAQTFSVTLYAFGLAESLQLLWPHLPQRGVAAATVVGVSLLATRGAGWALKLQIPIMVAIAVALASLGTGAVGAARESIPLWEQAPNPEPFWAVFAVFFPAVTGIMAGISLSGDLKDPKRSIPVGTLSAVAVGFVIYFAVPIVLAAVAPAAELAANNLIWFEVAAVPLLIFPGLWGAIFSSAVGSILGAPRTLEVLAEDRVLWPRSRRLPSPKVRRWLAHGLSTAVALLAVSLGDLNAVAPVLTMFFLTTYGMVNLVAGLEQLSGAPSYRPTIRVPWAVSLAGAVSCFMVMALINRTAAVVAVVLEVGLYLALRRRSMTATWGDLRFGALMSLARATVLWLRRLPVDPRNWRPHILLFAGDLEKRVELVRFAAWLNQDRGILTVCRLIVGELEQRSPEVAAELQHMDHQLEEEGLTAFPEVDIVSEFESGVLHVAQANGIAGITSNTLMFGWSDKSERTVSKLRIMRQATYLGKSTVMCRLAPRSPIRTSHLRRRRRIDVWWGGLQNNGDMLLLFAHLLAANPEWSRAQISVKSISSHAANYEQIEANLQSLLSRSRINAEAEIIRLAPGATVQDTIHEQSRDADVVFMGLQQPESGEEEAYASRLETLVEGLPTVILVRAAGIFAGQLLDEV
ncbi:MAG: Na-K-Cl cotransporter [Acidobacteriota bacterium]|nr:Na-K-Cl cotransporter [Acidobacteriota bacterium]